MIRKRITDPPISSLYTLPINKDYTDEIAYKKQIDSDIWFSENHDDKEIILPNRPKEDKPRKRNLIGVRKMSSDGRRKYRRDLYKLKIAKKVGTNKKHQIKDKAQRPTYMTSKEQDIQQKRASKKKETGAVWFK